MLYGYSFEPGAHVNKANTNGGHPSQMSLAV